MHELHPWLNLQRLTVWNRILETPFFFFFFELQHCRELFEFTFKRAGVEASLRECHRAFSNFPDIRSSQGNDTFVQISSF